MDLVPAARAGRPCLSGAWSGRRRGASV